MTLQELIVKRSCIYSDLEELDANWTVSELSTSESVIAWQF